MKGLRHSWWKAELMPTHRSVSERLPAYADGTLPDTQRAEVEAHLGRCSACAESLRQIRQLDLLLEDLPSTPYVPFPRFWTKLQRRLPTREQKRRPLVRPWRVATALAVAVLASLVGVTALASDGTMPDSPLYHVKRLRQGVQLAVATPRQRPRLQLALGKQRVREAVVMVERRHPELAVASLKDAHSLIVAATPQLEHPSSSQAETADLAGTVADLKQALSDAQQAADAQPANESGDLTAVDGAIAEDLNAVNQVESDVNATGTGSTEPTPEPSLEPSPAVEASLATGATDVASPQAPSVPPATGATPTP